ncbi:MAG: serine/threonine dehydratase [Deltaproteobacteria bacterium]|nr:MAG: serine/threonine dehydratase [Deltaproteobacteria bacterium]
MTLSINPDINDVLKAYCFLKNRVRHTPTEYSYPLSEKLGAPIYIKWENQQMCGSFKVRGAFYKMNNLNEEERARGVVTCSSGNHAQGVAIAAKELMINTKIYVPENCFETKKTSIKRIGGKWVELIVEGKDFDKAEEAAYAEADRSGRTHVSSFIDPDVIAGQGTTGFEIFIDQPEIECLIVPAGGGGLMNGVAIAAKALSPSVEVWGVQSEASNPWVVSWQDDIVKSVTCLDTIADGLAGNIPQSIFDLAKKRVSGIYEVNEEDIKRAIAYVHREHHQIVEGAGAVGIAALLSGKVEVKGRKTGVVISGGNIDDEILIEILEKY